MPKKPKLLTLETLLARVEELEKSHRDMQKQVDLVEDLESRIDDAEDAVDKLENVTSRVDDLESEQRDLCQRVDTLEAEADEV